MTPLGLFEQTPNRRIRCIQVLGGLDFTKKTKWMQDGVALLDLFHLVDFGTVCGNHVHPHVLIATEMTPRFEIVESWAIDLNRNVSKIRQYNDCKSWGESVANWPIFFYDGHVWEEYFFKV